MSTSSDLPVTHPVTRAVAGLHALLDDVVDQPVWSLPADETADLLQDVAEVEAKLTAVRCRLLVQAASIDVPALDGSPTLEAWVSHHTRTTRRAVRRDVALAEAIDRRWERVRAGLVAGAVTVEQAHVVVAALDALPASVEPAVVAAAEAELVRRCAEHDAGELRVLGRHVLDVVAPEVGEAEEARQLAAEESRAAARTRLTMGGEVDGLVHGRFALSARHAGMLRKVLFSIATRTGSPDADAAPASPATQGELDEETAFRRITPERLGHALCDLLECLPVESLPSGSRTSATVVVTMPLAALEGRLASAQLDTGQRVSPGTARYLACAAGLVPAVLDGASRVIDLGREQRFYVGAARLALEVRDVTCTERGCRVAAAWCHAHHDDPWSQGGRTDHDKGRLYCPSHHRRAHDPAYEALIGPDNQVSFHLRT